MADALFTRTDDAFLPSELSGGPWSPEHLHGGAPLGLLAAEVERHVDNDQLRLARLTVDLLRPVPKAPLNVVVDVIRPGKRLQVLQATVEAEGQVLTHATALFLERVATELPAFARFDSDTFPPRPAGESRTLMDLAAARRRSGPTPPPGLHSTVHVLPVDGMEGRGAGRVWMRLPVPVIAGESVSPLVLAATLSDFGNGVAQLRLAPNVGCINTDVSLYLHREPVGDWIGLDARSRMQDNGNGLVETTLHDERGPIGSVLQAILAMPVYRS